MVEEIFLSMAMTDIAGRVQHGFSIRLNHDCELAKGPPILNTGGGYHEAGGGGVKRASERASSGRATRECGAQRVIKNEKKQDNPPIRRVSTK